MSTTRTIMLNGVSVKEGDYLKYTGEVYSGHTLKVVSIGTRSVTLINVYGHELERTIDELNRYVKEGLR